MIDRFIGNTPLVRLERVVEPGMAEVWVKVEGMNPGGSIKDRTALGMVLDAERRGLLRPGGTIVEPTSGNTGIGLAQVASARGYRLILCLPASMSEERKRTLRAYGAELVLTDPERRMLAAIEEAERIRDATGAFLPNQFSNAANPEIHYSTTGPEIWEAMEGRIDAFVYGTGTGGTLKGVSRVLKKRSSKTRIVVCEPDVAALISSGEAQARHPDGSPAATHPRFSSHPVQGWTPDFIPKLAEDVRENIDTLLQISGSDAMKYSRMLAREEGIFVGISSGATLAGAIRIADDAPQGSNILAMLPDTGERYLSTPLFENVAVDMNEEELAISKSTPGYQFE